MKTLLKASIFLSICIFLIACDQSAVPATLPVPSSTHPSTATTTPLPNNTPTLAIRSTATPEYIPPTLIPTIDPTLVPEILRTSISVQVTDGVNGHKVRQITGWEYGFGGENQYGLCPGYKWLDTSHILFYPEAGQTVDFIGDGVQRVSNVVPQAAVINLENGSMWLPSLSRSYRNCKHVYWSEELKILITSEVHGESTSVATYTAAGDRLASYPGLLMDVSPRGTKILIGDNTLIDLKTNKTIKLSWSLEEYYEPHLSRLYWTYPEETRVYRCCYFYADLTTGISHRFKRSDFQDENGTHLDERGLWFHQGEWVRDNKYFLAHWLAVDDGPVRYQPLFDPATKLFYDLWDLAGVSRDLTWRYNKVSPDGDYVWIVGTEASYLINLINFESWHFPYNDPYTDTEGNWSADSKFVWFETHVYSGNESAEFQILSIADGKLSPIPITPLSYPNHWWHPIKAVVVYPAADKESLIFLDPATMSYRELPFTLHQDPSTPGQVAWNPSGEKLAMIASDGSLWQVDYPALEQLEQLTPGLSEISDLGWSPDGNSISFVSGSDIYVVETNK